MTKTLFTQSEETRYYNNEFSNMPSIDYRSCYIDLNGSNKSIVDWVKVDEICAKHGFKCIIINSTFGGNDITVLIAKKTDISNDYYVERYKADDWKTLWEIKEKHKDTFLQLHNCLNELDLETNLYFDCVWHGNCGLFGSDDVNRESYSSADILRSYYNITRWLEPSIHDTRSKIDSNGVYILGHTTYAKIDLSFIFNEFTWDMALATAMELQPQYNIAIEHGKRQSDTHTKGYDALVVRHKNGEYMGSMIFSKDMHGIVQITTRGSFGVEHTFKTKRDDFRKDMADELLFIIG